MAYGTGTGRTGGWRPPTGLVFTALILILIIVGIVGSCGSHMDYSPHPDPPVIQNGRPVEALHKILLITCKDWHYKFRSQVYPCNDDGTITAANRPLVIELQFQPIKGLAPRDMPVTPMSVHPPYGRLRFFPRGGVEVNPAYDPTIEEGDPTLPSLTIESDGGSVNGIVALVCDRQVSNPESKCHKPAAAGGRLWIASWKIGVRVEH
jgi:hypothetical protein